MYIYIKKKLYKKRKQINFMFKQNSSVKTCMICLKETIKGIYNCGNPAEKQISSHRTHKSQLTDKEKFWYIHQDLALK